MKKRILVFVITLVLLPFIYGTATETAEGTELATHQYTGTLKVPKTSYVLKAGEYVLDGSNVWTVQEAEKVTVREGLICTWEHDGKTEGLADYSSGIYPEYMHYCENENIFAPCYVIIYGQSENMYRTYDEFRMEIARLYAIPGAAAKVETYNAYYAKNPGKTSFVYKNGNLSIIIPVIVQDSSAPPDNSSVVQGDQQVNIADESQNVGSQVLENTVNTNEDIDEKKRIERGEEIISDKTRDQIEATSDSQQKNEPDTKSGENLKDQITAKSNEPNISLETDKNSVQSNSRKAVSGNFSNVEEEESAGNFKNTASGPEEEFREDGKNYLYLVSSVAVVLIITGSIIYLKKRF